MSAGRGGAGEDRTRRVKDLFERALDASPAQREAILAEGGRATRGEVEALLATVPSVGEFLEVSAAHLLLGPAPRTRHLCPGDEVAGFTVVAVLGEGGGGVVYEARQREPERLVALKTIRVRSRGADAMRTFRDEAASLARLHHAAIAHVYSAGVRDAPGGAQPWIAMELIRGGRTIVEHASRAGLSRDARLSLFVPVCDALHHAHENGVIHRDVKPGNVLVDAEGHPKVVDFGVACGVAQAADGQLADGGAGDAVGTVAYASPEQLAGPGGSVDRRADVYGLGALLYELLTGAVPHEVDAMPLAEAARTKAEVPPAPPSARAAGIPRDLDAIVMRALAPDPSRRYESAAALGADIARFLAGEPVTAYPGGSWYALGKFARRRRAAAAALAGIAAALVAGTAVSLWFAVEEARARGDAERRAYVSEIAAASAALRTDDVTDARHRLDRAPPALRDWEWRHLAARLDGSSETIAFARRELWYGAVSRDGALLAVSGIDRDAPGGGGVFASLARRDGTTLATWHCRPDAARGTMTLVRDGATVGEWTSADISGIPSVALSPDGRRLALGLNTGGVLLHDVARGTDAAVFAAHADRVIAVAFSPDGSRLATAGKDGAARLWSAADAAPLATFAGHGDRVICLAFDPAGARLVTGCRDGSIRVFDTATGALLSVLTGHEQSVEGVSVSPDGTRLASASRDRTVRLWDLADGRVIAIGRSHASNVRDVAFDPRGGSFVSASWDGTLRVWDARTGAETALLRGHGSAVTAVAFAERAPRLASFSRDATVKLWDLERADVATCRELRGAATALAFDDAGARVAAAGDDGRLSILDARTARVTQAVDAAEGGLGAVAFLDARRLVVLSRRHQLQVWDVPDGPPDAAAAPACVLRVADGSYHGAMAVDRGRGAAWLTTAARAANVAVYDTLTSVDLRSGAILETRHSPVDASAVACDGRGGVVVAGRDGTVAYSPAPGAWRTARLGTSALLSVAFDAAGGRIVAGSADGTARVLRAADLSTALVLEGHAAEVNQAAFLPGGRRIVTVSRDLTARLWDAADGENVLVLHGHGYPVLCVAVSPDGTRIATGAGATEDVQSNVKIWEAPAR